MLEFNSVSFAFQNIKIFNNISCRIDPNTFVCIIGMNGAGKSTFAKLAVGLLSPQKGSVRYNDRSLSLVKIGYLQQKLSLPEGVLLSVKEFVMMGLLGPYKLFFSSADFKKTQEVLEECRVQDKMHSSLQSLSSGQLQRVLIARLLVMDPEFTVLDEPFESLDFYASQVLLEELKSIRHTMTVLMISHNPEMISMLADKVLCISNHHEHHNFIEYFLKHKHIPVEHICV